MTCQNDDVFDFWTVLEAPTYQTFSPSDLFQMLNDCRMVDVEFFSTFLCSCKKINFDDCPQLAVVTF